MVIGYEVKKSGIVIPELLFTGNKRDVFFVNALSQKTGELQRQNAVPSFCVHREACYCSQHCGFLQGCEQ